MDVPVHFLGAPPAFTATRTVTASVGSYTPARAATEHRPIAFSGDVDSGRELVPALHGVNPVDE